MAHQSVLPRGKSWSTGSTGTGSFPSSSATRWLTSERLKKLDQDARTSSSEMELLEADIHDLSKTLEKLKKFDTKRVERLAELADGEVVYDVKKKNFDTQDANGLNGEGQHGLEDKEGAQVERSGEGEVNEEVESLRSEHGAAQSQIQYIEASLEKKRVELEVLAEKHRTLTDLIAEEEKHAQAAEIDESMQQSVPLQQETKSLPEDMGRLVRLMEGLKETNADPLKQDVTRPQQKPRMYHPVTQHRSRSRYRLTQNGGGASDLGRSASVGDAPMGISRIKESTRSKEPSRIKEPAEFEEREGGGNRKRQKSSSFERERERLHKERAKLEVEAKEKSQKSSSFERERERLHKERAKLEVEAKEKSQKSRSFERERERLHKERAKLEVEAKEKSQKSSSFERERERLHKERAKLEVEAKEKRLLDSLASFSSQPQPQPSKGAPGALGSSPSSRDISSPSSVFEGFGETPLGLATSGSTVLMSDSSESTSSEISTEKLDSNSISSAVKRLDFETFGEENSPSSGAIASLPLETVSKPSYATVLTKNSLADNVDIGREKAGEEQKLSSIETDDESSSSENGIEEFEVPAANSINNTLEEILGIEGISPVSGVERIQGPEILSSEVEGKRESEILIPRSAPEEEIERSVSEVVNFQLGVLESFSEGFGNPVGDTDAERTLEEAEINTRPRAAKDEVEEIDIPTEELDSFRDAGGEEQSSKEGEVITTRNKVEEIEVPEEDIADFEGIEYTDETSERKIPKKESGSDNVDRFLETKSDVRADDDGEDEAIEVGQSTTAQAPELQVNGFKSSEPVNSGLHSPPEAGQLDSGEMNDGRNNRRLEAENQMMQLSSQLSLLQKQVEEEVELHEKSNTESQHEHTFAEKEQLSKQVSFFADEVRGLRQNIDEIQRIIHKEGELSVVEHWAKDLHSKCADQSAQLEHLGKQISMLGNDLKHHLQLSGDMVVNLDKEAQERHKVETQLSDLSKALAITVSTMEKEEEAMSEVIQHQKHLLVDQLKEAEKLRHIAEVRVLTLNDQIEQLEMVCDAAKSIQAVTKYQDKAVKVGLQTIMQLFLLALGVITLYSRVADPFRGSLVPT